MSLFEVVEFVALLRVFVGVRQVSLVQWIKSGEFEALSQYIERLLHLLGTEGHCVSADSVDYATRFHHTLSPDQNKVDGLHDVTDRGVEDQCALDIRTLQLFDHQLAFVVDRTHGDKHVKVFVLLCGQSESLQNYSRSRMRQDSLKKSENNIQVLCYCKPMQMLTHASVGDERQRVLGDNVTALLELLQEDLAAVEHNGLHLVHRLGLKFR